MNWILNNWQLLAVAFCGTCAGLYLGRRLIATLRAAARADGPTSTCHGCSGKCDSNSSSGRVIELVDLQARR